MKTTLYFSNEVEASEYPYGNLTTGLTTLGFKLKTEEHTFIFEGLEISYKLRHKHIIQKYILSFSPKRPDEQLTVSETKRRYDIMCRLIDKLPDKITVGDLKFLRSEILDTIDMNQWEIKDIFTSKKMDLFDIYDYKKLRSLYEKKIPLKPVFMVLDKSNNTSTIINALKLFFSQKEEIMEVSTLLVREKISIRTDMDQIFVFMLCSQENDQYIKLKKYFLQNNIPSQFVNLDDKSIWFKTKNLIPEILTKSSCCPFEFPENLSKVDGYLCLNDIYDKTNPLFGINITYNSEKNVFNNTIKVYSDIKYASNRFSIQFGESLDLLIEKIISLGAEIISKKINIYLTKYWKSREIYLMIEKLKSSGIIVKKIFYISFFSDKFVFVGMNSLEDTKIPYIIKDKYLAYLQPNTKIGLFGSLFPVSLELANSKSGEIINKEDIEEYLWLIKRRVYRLQYINMLRYPEFIHYVKKLRKLNLNEEDLSKLSFNGDLLI